MKPETLIYDKVRKILPQDSEKTIFFVGMTKTSQEVFFYSFAKGQAVQCYTLAEQYELDENELAEVFSAIADIIRKSSLFKPENYNVATIAVDSSGLKLEMEYHPMDLSEYRIQKEWKSKYIV